MINAYWEGLEFRIQEGAPKQWRRVVDTSLESPLDFAEPGSEHAIASLNYRVAARSVVILFSKRARDPGFSVTENFPKVIEGPWPPRPTENNGDMTEM